MKPIISNDLCYEMIAMIKSNNTENISDDDYEMIHVNVALRYLNQNL